MAWLMFPGSGGSFSRSRERPPLLRFLYDILRTTVTDKRKPKIINLSRYHLSSGVIVCIGLLRLTKPSGKFIFKGPTLKKDILRKTRTF